MCNHYRADPDYRAQEVSETRIEPFPRRWHGVNDVATEVYPGRYGQIVMTEDGELVEGAAYWRFVPWTWKGSLRDWAKPSKPGAVRGKSCNNARGETADTTAMWREAAKKGRCLIPARGFFEWGVGPDGKGEHYFAPAAGGTLWLGGLCGWAEPEDGRMLTYTMVTKPCGAETSAIGHHRQPVNLQGDQLQAWLDPASPVRDFLEMSPAGTFTIERQAAKAEA